MTATANDNSPDAQVLSELLDGELLGDNKAAPLSDACVATWRGYCLAGSVLRGELNGADTLDLAARIRHQITSDADLRATFDDAGTPPLVPVGAPVGLPDRVSATSRRGWHRKVGVSRWTGTRWQQAARARPRLGAAVALGAAAVSVAIGVSVFNGGGDRGGPNGVSVAGVGAPVLLDAPAISLASVPAGASSADAMADSGAVGEPTAIAPSRAVVPHVEEDNAMVAHGQLPYFFAHASATNAAYHSGSMNLMPIAATDLATQATVAVRH